MLKVRPGYHQIYETQNAPSAKLAAVGIRLSTIPVLADVGSAYFLAFVVLLFWPVPSLTSAPLLDVAAVGALASSFLVIVDPVNKALHPLARRRLAGNARAEWAIRLFNQTVGNVPYLDSGDKRRSFLLQTAAQAFLTPYLSRERAKLSSGFIFALIFLGLAAHVGNQGWWTLLPLAFALLSFVTLASIFFEVLVRIPEYCWILAVYGFIVQFVGKQLRGSQRGVDLPGIAKLLSSSNWQEAAQWLEYYLSP